MSMRPHPLNKQGADRLLASGIGLQNMRAPPPKLESRITDTRRGSTLEA